MSVGPHQSSDQDDPPPRPRSFERPHWALPVFILGVLCSLMIGWISARWAQDLAQGASPSLAMASTFALAPFLIAGLPLLLAGTLGVARPWRRQRPWLPAAIVVGVIGWLFVMLAGPGFVIS